MEIVLPGYLTVKELANRLGVTPGRVRQLLVELKDENGEMPGTMVGPIRMLAAKDVQLVERLHGDMRPYTGRTNPPTAEDLKPRAKART